ncbi:MAG TPA: hypothetical protein VK988_22425, partial [Acidimicrobiales bacterium]|nr:hypothetical protein [Acidimicrobiales bacterium]
MCQTYRRKTGRILRVRRRRSRRGVPLRSSREAPADLDALAAVEASDIVVVQGSYDQVELVLDALDLRGPTPTSG